MSNLKNLTKPKAIFLDLDNTLYPYERANEIATEKIFEYLVENYSYDLETLKRALNKAKVDVKAQLGTVAASHSRLLYYKTMFENLGLKSQPALVLKLDRIFWTNFLLNIKLYNGVIDFLYKARSLDIQLLVLTDLTAEIQMRKLVYLEIDSLVDYLVTSEEVGVEKPSEKMFDKACSLVGVEPKDIWMIGDDPAKDLVGAEKYGIIPIQKIDGNKGAINSKYYIDSFYDLFPEDFK